MWLKKSLIALLIGCFFNPWAVANEQSIRQVLAEQQNAWNQGDLKAYMQGYWQSEQLQFVGKSGINKGWQATLDNYQATYPDRKAMGQLAFELLDIQVEGDTAFVLGKWQLTKEKDNPSGYFTLLWKKIDGQWRIVIDHSS